MFQLLLHLLTNYTSNLRCVQLNGNKVKKVTLDAVKDIIKARHQDLSDTELSDSDVISSVDWSVTGKYLYGDSLGWCVFVCIFFLPEKTSRQAGMHIV